MKIIEPSEILIIKGLSSEITEKMILEKINELNYYPEYVRIFRNKLSGLSKGSGLIRFKSLEESTSFLKNHASIEIKDSATWLEFGFEHSSADWTCTSCKSINFQQRDVCFKCSISRTAVLSLKPVNDGSDDISIQPTRFLLIRNLDAELTAQKIFEELTLHDSNLNRVWLLLDRASQKSTEFAFLEFPSMKESEAFLYRQAIIGVLTKMNSKGTLLTFGRDLSLLTQSLSGAMNGKITYWDNNYEFAEYPVYTINVPEIIIKEGDSSVLGIPSKRHAIGAVPSLIQKGPPKKIQLQLKNWTAKAYAIEPANEISTTPFVREQSLRNQTENKFIDMTFLCCILCDIKYESESELIHHAQNSSEHSNKFEEYWRKSVIDEKDSETYIDRAAERREAFGVTEEEVKRIVKESRPSYVRISETTTTDPPADVSDSIGAKMLKKMGWKEGTGLGKDSTGITEAVKGKTSEQARAGIGAANLISADEIKFKSYNDRVRGNRSKRYND